MWQAAILRDRQAVSGDVDVSFKRARAFGVGDGDRCLPVALFVRRETDDIVRIASAQEIDLVELDFVVFGRVERDAVVDRQRNAAAIEELDQVVDILQRRATGGDDDRLFGGRNLLDQDPVVDVRTGDLDELDAKLDAKLHRDFIERRRHGDAACLSDGVDQRRVFEL